MNESTNSIASVTELEATPKGKYSHWIAEVTAAEKRLKDWHSSCDKILEIYEDTRDIVSETERRFNLFTANVDTVGSILYANIPRVEVSRKFKDMDDDRSRVAANILERSLQTGLDDVDNDFDDAITDSIFDRLTGGMGQVWLRIEGEGEAKKVVIEHLHFKDFLWSPCRKWSERRWVARKAYMTKEEGLKRFGDKFKLVTLDKELADKSSTEFDDLQTVVVKKATVYEIWDRVARRVIWLSKSYKDILDDRDDYYGLKNFEPCPRPLFASMTTSRAVPIPDYKKAQDQYEELNSINSRLSRLTEACKVVGIYNQAHKGIARMLTEGSDNTLIPIDSWDMFAEKGGIKGNIEWLPLDQIVSAINQLTLAAESRKQQIYELTGISDIIRGATKATETAAAQKLKANYASSKQQSLQKKVEKFVCDCLKLKAELEVKHFPPEFFVKASNINNTPDRLLAPDAIALLKKDGTLSYNIAIKPDSMAQVDYAAEKQDRMELLTAVGGYLEKSMQLMAGGEPMQAMLVIGMLKFSVAGFRAGKEFEGILDTMLFQIQQAQQQKMANPQPPPPNPDMLIAQAKLQSEQVKQQGDQARQQGEAQLIQLKIAAEQNKGQLDTQKAQADFAKTQIEVQLKQIELQLKQIELQTALAEASTSGVENQERLNFEKEAHRDKMLLETAGLSLEKDRLDHVVKAHEDKVFIDHRKINHDHLNRELDRENEASESKE